MIKLQPVNVHTLFCKGCGIAPAPEEGQSCITCLFHRASQQKPPARRPGQLPPSGYIAEPLPIKIHIAFALALAVFIAGMVIALRI